MGKDTPRTTILSLPVELRLEIAAYVFDQPNNMSIEQIADHSEHESRRHLIPSDVSAKGFWIPLTYSASANFSLLLVCRQLRYELVDLAFQQTRFVMSDRPGLDKPDFKVSCLLKERICNIRKLVLVYQQEEINAMLWKQYPFNKEAMHLDELCIAFSPHVFDMGLIDLLRRLKNVKTVTFLLGLDLGCPKIDSMRVLGKIVGAMLKMDHYYRYDAPGAPIIEDTWWDWHFDSTNVSLVLEAREPKPLLAEEDYMNMIKPKVDELMLWMEHHL
jgi:hypothetical protein